MTDIHEATWSYRPGPWYAIFGSDVALLLPPAQRTRVIDLWSLIEAGASFDEVLDGLLAAGLSALPGFALVSRTEGPVRVLVRGTGVVATIEGTETVTLEGASGGTWSERTVEDVTALTVTVVDGEDDEDDEPRDPTDYAIPAGLVQVTRIDLPAAAAPAAPEEAAPALAVVPDVAVEPDEIEPDEVEAEQIEAEFGEDVEADEADEDVAEEPGEPGEPEEPEGETTEPIVPEDDALEAGESTEDTPYGWMTPWGTPPAAESVAAESPVPAEDATGAPESGEASLVADPPPAAEEAGPAGEPVVGDDTDHDGMTNSGGVIGDRRPATGLDEAAPAPGTAVAALHSSDGQTVVVDRPVIIGRAPEARRFTATEQPTLVTVPSRLHEISSTHVEVRPGSGADHGSAVVTDMGSTNGTVLEQPGLDPEDLKPGVPVSLVPGAVINLGDGITIQVTRP